MFKQVGSVMPNWNLHRVDPGYIYIVEDQGRYKIGKSRHAHKRLTAARTWLPDMTLIGQKPFWGMSYHERCLHAGLAGYWYFGEWFDFADDKDARDCLLDGFLAFSNDDPDRNSVDFIYWFNGDGMSEYLMEQAAQGLTLTKFQRQESISRKVTL